MGNSSKRDFFVGKVDMDELASSLMAALESKDEYTSGHSERVAMLATEIAVRLGFDSEGVFIVRFAAHLHDIGKVGIIDSVLCKPGRLTKEEFVLIQKHPVLSGKILEKSKAFRGIAKIARHHHERFDGRGYPDGLKSEEIPLISRIISVADAFDAMVSRRSYKASMSLEDTMNELRRNSGTQFDPEIVKVVENIYKEDREALEFIVTSSKDDFWEYDEKKLCTYYQNGKVELSEEDKRIKTGKEQRVYSEKIEL